MVMTRTPGRRGRARFPLGWKGRSHIRGVKDGNRGREISKTYPSLKKGHLGRVREKKRCLMFFTLSKGREESPPLRKRKKSSLAMLGKMRKARFRRQTDGGRAPARKMEKKMEKSSLVSG